MSIGLWYDAAGRVQEVDVNCARIDPGLWSPGSSGPGSHKKLEPEPFWVWAVTRVGMGVLAAVGLSFALHSLCSDNS